MKQVGSNNREKESESKKYRVWGSAVLLLLFNFLTASAILDYYVHASLFLVLSILSALLFFFLAQPKENKRRTSCFKLIAALLEALFYFAGSLFGLYGILSYSSHQDYSLAGHDLPGFFIFAGFAILLYFCFKLFLEKVSDFLKDCDTKVAGEK